MHLLFATSIIPDAAGGSGYEIASAAVIAALRENGARITVAGYLWPDQAMPQDPDTLVLGRLDPRTDGASMPTKLGWLARAAWRGLPFASAKLHALPPAGLRALLQAAGRFDAYVLNGAQFAAAFEPVFADRPKLFVAHNVEHRSAAENAAAASGFERLLFRREARRLRAVEERLCREAAFTFTFAEEDRAAFGLSDRARAAALPLVTRASAPQASPREITCDAALIGTWTWVPNRIGLEWFLDSVLPRLPADFRVRIAGSAPADLPARYPRAEWVGRVPDATAFVRSAAVVPLVSRAGTGVQLKTIETFELGLPAIATAHSLRGIGHMPANCRLADDAETFAAALVEAARKKLPDADGSLFWRGQRDLLVRRVGQALERLSSAEARRAVA